MEVDLFQKVIFSPFFCVFQFLVSAISWDGREPRRTANAKLLILH